MNETAARVRFTIGEIYLMHFSGRQNEQCGIRPGLVVQNNVGNECSPNIIALPLTSRIKKLGQPTHVLIRAGGGRLRKDSVVLCENPECMSKDRVGQYITTLSDEEMRRVAAASLLATSVISFLDRDTLISVYERAKRMNARR